MRDDPLSPPGGNTSDPCAWRLPPLECTLADGVAARDIGAGAYHRLEAFTDRFEERVRRFVRTRARRTTDVDAVTENVFQWIFVSATRDEQVFSDPVWVARSIGLGVDTFLPDAWPGALVPIPDDGVRRPVPDPPPLEHSKIESSSVKLIEALPTLMRPLDEIRRRTVELGVSFGLRLDQVALILRLTHRAVCVYLHSALRVIDTRWQQYGGRP